LKHFWLWASALTFFSSPSTRFFHRPIPNRTKIFLNGIFPFSFLKKLETILPPKPKIEIPAGEHVDEVSMIEYENTKGSSSSHGAAGGGYGREAYANGSDDEDGPGGQRVECNTH
jgi:hypothetical protein